MFLAELIETVQKLKMRIDKYRQELQKSEALTRYVLIDPFLRALGWDTENPEVIRPEFTTSAGKPDYALFHNGQRIAFIGVKALGKQEDLLQHVSYCVSEGVRYFITSDGSRWEVYDTHIQKPLPEKRLAEWDITSMEPGEVVRNAFSIMRHAGIGKPPTTIIFPPPPPPGTPLSNLKLKPGEELRYERIRFPDGSEQEIHAWRDILVSTVKWLSSTGKLLPPPIITVRLTKKHTTYLINKEPKHKNGRPFKNPRQVDGLYIECSYSNKDIVKHTIRLLNLHSIDPKEVFLISGSG